MTTKQVGSKAIKASKQASAVVYVPTKAHIAIAATAGSAAGSMVSSRIAFNDAAKALFMAKVTIGDARKCPLAQAFLSARFPAKVAASTKANALAAFRAAVASGKDYDENATTTAKRIEAKATKAKPAAATKPATVAVAAVETKAKPATAVAATKPAAVAVTPAATDAYVITIGKKASAKKASATIRDLANKIKDNEEFSLLAACLIDALDEFDSEE